MTLIDVTAVTVGCLGVLAGVRSYVELWRWARQCQNARIAIAHKQRVQINAPLVEWLTWANQLRGDETSQGRVVYRNGHVSVAIFRPRKVSRPRAAIMRARGARKRNKAATPAG